MIYFDFMSNTIKTVRDFTRYAMTQMERHDVNLGHGSVDLWQEATFLVMRYLKLPFDRLESFWDANLTEEESQELFNLIEKRTIEKIPAPYLLREAWISEVGGMVVLDHREIHFRPRSDGF
mgnify:CR=1 FL=1